MPIRVVIADDQNMVREGLRQLLVTQADIAVVGEASDGLEAVELAKRLNPDILLLDLAMPVLGGLEAARRVLRDVKNTRIVILSMYRTEDYAHHARAAGAQAYVMKGTPGAELLDAIRGVHDGRDLLAPARLAVPLHG